MSASSRSSEPGEPSAGARRVARFGVPLFVLFGLMAIATAVSVVVVVWLRPGTVQMVSGIVGVVVLAGGAGGSLRVRHNVRARDALVRERRNLVLRDGQAPAESSDSDNERSGGIRGASSPPDGFTEPANGARAERWLFRVFAALVGGVMIISGLITSVEVAGDLRNSSGDQTGLVLSLIGGVLRSAGLAVLVFRQAVVFRDLGTFLRPFSPPPGVPRTHKGRRRQRQQISGARPWTEAELPTLRSHASWLQSLSVSRVEIGALFTLLVGAAIAPLDLGTRAGTDPRWAHAFQAGSALLLLVLVVSLIAHKSQRAAAHECLQ